MAIITLAPRGTLIGARRLFSRSGFSLTVRSGRICTKRLVPQADPRTPAQLSARHIFAAANRLAVRVLARPGQREYWQKEAARLGYRTPIGAARAHYIALLRARAASARRPLSRRHSANAPLSWRRTRIHTPRRSSFRAPALPPSVPRRLKSPSFLRTNRPSRLQVSIQTANFAYHINWTVHGFDPDRRRPPAADKV